MFRTTGNPVFINITPEDIKGFGVGLVKIINKKKDCHLDNPFELM